MSPLSSILNQNSRPSFHSKNHFSYFETYFRRIFNIIAKSGNQKISYETKGANFGQMTKLKGLPNAVLALLFEY